MVKTWRMSLILNSYNTFGCLKIYVTKTLVMKHIVKPDCTTQLMLGFILEESHLNVENVLRLLGKTVTLGHICRDTHKKAISMPLLGRNHINVNNVIRLLGQIGTLGQV